MRFNYKIRRATGFSLVELAVVLVIIGSVLGIVLSGLGTVTHNAANTTARVKQVALQDNLLSYLRANGRLPCPDTGQPGSPAGISPANLPDGVENRATEPPPDVTTLCLRHWGVVPYVTLGIPREAALDPWGNFFTYVASNNALPSAPLTATPKRDWVISSNFGSGSLGDIQVNDDAGVGTNAVAVIISHGANGSGGFTTKATPIAAPAGADELNNAAGCPRQNPPNLLRCFKREFTESSAGGGAFDDVVQIITPEQLLSPLFAQSVLLPPRAGFENQCSKIRDSLVSKGMANRTGTTPLMSYNVTPAPYPVIHTLNTPYGEPLTATFIAPTPIEALTSAGDIVSVTSLGPDGTLGGGDDQICQITVDDLRAAFLKAGGF